jgi:hypothetical protein
MGRTYRFDLALLPKQWNSSAWQQYAESIVRSKFHDNDDITSYNTHAKKS